MPFLVYTFFILILHYINATFSLADVLFILLGFTAWNCFEYGFHRFAFHNRKLSNKMKRTFARKHFFHHKYPKNTDELFLPLTLTFSLSTLVTGLIYILFGFSPAVWFYTFLVLGYFFYEFTHYAAHHLNLKNHYFKYMKRYHLAHHHKNPNSKFMVSFPLFDWIFKTG